MNKLSKCIEEAIEECKAYGGVPKVILDDNTYVTAAWVDDDDKNFDVIYVYLYRRNIIKFSYKIEETKISK